jgi:hypothetical protein
LTWLLQDFRGDFLEGSTTYISAKEVCFFKSRSFLFFQLARDIPYAAIQFMTFETLKKAYGVNRPLKAGETKRPAVSEAKKVLTNLWMGAVSFPVSLFSLSLGVFFSIVRAVGVPIPGCEVFLDYVFVPNSRYP